MSAEAAVLGACLVDATAYWRIADLLKPAHFADHDDRRVFTAIRDAAAKGDAFDAVTLSDTFGRYPLDLANGQFSTANVRAYATRVFESYQGRAVTGAAQAILAFAGTGSERLTEAQRLVREISTGSSPVKTAKDVLRDVVPAMQRECDGTAAVGVTTGWAHVDAATGGMRGGELWIVAGRPSMGKSVFAMQAAMHVAVAGRSVHVATLEMTAEETLRRMIAAESRVQFAKVRNAGEIEPEDWPRIMDATSRLANAKLTLDDAAYGLEEICARVRQRAMSDGLDLVVIDYLGYIQLPKADSYALSIQDGTRTLKRLAKELQIPVVLVAQLNREVGSRSSHRPVLTDLRDSGAIEQDADVVILLHRDDYYAPECETAGFAEAIIAKQRNGQTRALAFRHRFDVMRFEEAEGLPSVERPTRGFAKSRWSAGSDRASGTGS